MSPRDCSISGPIHSLEFENECTKDLGTPLVESVLRNEPKAVKNCPRNEITWIRERKRWQNSILPMHADSIQAMFQIESCPKAINFAKRSSRIPVREQFSSPFNYPDYPSERIVKKNTSGSQRFFFDTELFIQGTATKEATRVPNSNLFKNLSSYGWTYAWPARLNPT